jgi:hypothetical protein
LAIDPRRYFTDLSSKISSTGETTLELDSHADTCVLGRDALIFLDYNQPVVVEGYADCALWTAQKFCAAQPVLEATLARA